MACPCRYFSKTLLFSMQQKEQQQKSHFKFDRTANCHSPLLLNNAFQYQRGKQFMTTNTKDIEHTFVFLSLFPPTPYPLKEKQGIENHYSVYTSRNSFSLKSTEYWRKWLLEDLLSNLPLMHGHHDVQKTGGGGRKFLPIFKNGLKFISF